MWLLLAVAFPAVFVNLGHGHNGFLTAALIGTALLVLDRRPIVAGILFGLMSYKPQFGVMIPLVLLVTGRWQAFFSAAATVLALVAISTLAFGADVWRMMIDALPFTREVVLEQGGTGWHKIQSVFSWARMWGGSVAFAYAAQAAVTVALGAALAWLWRSDASYRLKAAALPIASILATPYSLDYDLMALAPSIAFLAVEGYERGFRPYEKTALAFLWFMPLIARTVADQTLIPLAVPAMLLVFCCWCCGGRLRTPAPFHVGNRRRIRLSSGMLTRRAALTAIAGLIAAPHARAQAFPSRNISIVVPYPAGGPVDAVARLIAQAASGPLGQSILVDNRGGASGVIGSVAVARAEPDGHTLVLGTNQTHATNQIAAQELPLRRGEGFCAGRRHR